MNWDEAIKELDNRRQRALAGGGQSKIDKQHAGGKMTARERIEVLLDPGTFVEVDGFIESRIDDFDLDKRRVPGDGVVTGYGEIDGRQVFVASEEFTVIGDVEKYAERNKVMKINEQWEELKEETHANIQSEKGILKRQIRSIQTEGHFVDIKENEKFRRFHYRSTEKVYKEFMLYAIGRNINKNITVFSIMRSVNLKEKTEKKQFREKHVSKNRNKGFLRPKISAIRENENIPWRIVC